MNLADRLVVAFLILGAASNAAAAVFAAGHRPLSLGIAIACGLMAIVVAISP